MHLLFIIIRMIMIVKSFVCWSVLCCAIPVVSKACYSDQAPAPRFFSLPDHIHNYVCLFDVFTIDRQFYTNKLQGTSQIYWYWPSSPLSPANQSSKHQSSKHQTSINSLIYKLLILCPYSSDSSDSFRNSLILARSEF